MTDPKWLTELEEKARADLKVEILMLIHPNEVLRLLKLVKKMADAVDYSDCTCGRNCTLCILNRAKKAYQRGPLEGKPRDLQDETP